MLNPLLDRQDSHETAKRVVESMSFLLFELQEIRDKYMLETPHLSDDHLEPTARNPFPRPTSRSDCVAGQIKSTNRSSQLSRGQLGMNEDLTRKCKDSEK
jgi:hypothetical protein